MNESIQTIRTIQEISDTRSDIQTMCVGLVRVATHLCLPEIGLSLLIVAYSEMTTSKFSLTTPQTQSIYSQVDMPTSTIFCIC